MVQIYHNPRCAKSRETLALLESKKVKPEIILYLDHPPTKKQLKLILEKLGMKASELIRKGEAIYKEQYKSKSLTEAQWIQAMIDHPKLMERPIVIKGQRAVLGRPPENVLEII